MLAMKSFRTAAVMLAGVELAHRIRKRQFSFGRGGPRRFSSLKQLWARALAHHDFATDRKEATFGNDQPPLHQNSAARMLTETEFEAIRPVRYAHKVWDGRGLYLLVTPKGGRYWRFAYRFARKHKTLSLGTYPVITPEWARSRHEFARNLLAQGVDPSALKAALGMPAFAARMREWAIERGHLSALPLSVAEAIRVLRL